MNAGTNFVLILSLLLALAAGSSAMKEQKGEESDPTSPSKIAINHNETMLSSAAPAYTWSLLADIQALFFGGSTVATTRDQKEEPDGTPPSRIAINHNETMLSVAAPAYAWSDLLADIQAFFSSRPVGSGGGCDEWVCGGNHNETMLSDTTSVQQPSMFSDLLMSIRAFLFDRPTPGGCDEFGCGGNHNETLLFG